MRSLYMEYIEPGNAADFYAIEVAGDGNCFFYACWESARLQGISTFKDLAVDKLQRYQDKTTTNALATDKFPAIDAAHADKLQTVHKLLKGLDTLIADKLHSLDELQTTDKVFETLSKNFDNSIMNQQRYEQQKAFAWFMRKLLASSKEYKQALNKWKDRMIEWGFVEHDQVENFIKDLTPSVSVHYYDFKLPVKGALEKFVQDMPLAFSNNSYQDRLWVTEIELDALRAIFKNIGLNLNIRYSDPIDPGRPTIFAIHNGAHYTAAIPRKVVTSATSIETIEQRISAVNEKTIHSDPEKRSSQEESRQQYWAEKQKTRDRQRLGGNRTRKR